jgi:hypothetical protein
MSDRLKGFEQVSRFDERKYELDQEQQFRVLARRDHLFGLWLAEKFGYAGDAALAYAKAVVESNFEKPGDEDMLDKVRRDIAAEGVAIADAELHAKLGEFQIAAARQIAAS